MCKFLALFRSKVRDVQASDFGRRFGWFIERNGECIGELDYSRWDESSQFWHEYIVRWRQSECDTTEMENWAESGIELRNREFSDVVIRDFLSASGCERGTVSIRGALVPEERFHKSTKKANKACNVTGDNLSS